MTKEQLEILKNEIREELKAELNKAIEDNKTTQIWAKYMKEEVIPRIDKKFDNGKIRYNLRNAINTIARIKVNKNLTCKITKEDLEEIKPLVETILTQMEVTE